MSLLREVVESSNDADLFDAVTEYLHRNVCKPREPYESYSLRMNEGQRMVILMWCLSVEAANGGIHQYLFNSSGDCVHETIDHLRRIGAVEQVEAFDRVASEVFDGEIPIDRNQRVRRLQEFGPNEETMTVEEYDVAEQRQNSFFRSIDKDFGWCSQILSLATRYIRQHPEEFS